MAQCLQLGATKSPFFIILHHKTIHCLVSLKKIKKINPRYYVRNFPIDS